MPTSPEPPDYVEVRYPAVLYTTILADYTDPPQHGLVYMTRDPDGQLVVHKVATLSVEDGRIYGVDGVMLSG